MASWSTESREVEEVQKSAEKPKMGSVERKQLNTEQLCLSQELPELGHHIPSGSSPCPKGLMALRGQ